MNPIARIETFTFEVLATFGSKPIDKNKIEMSNPAITNKRDILLLLLYSPGKSNNFNEQLIGRTKLIKTIFLFNNEVWKKFKGDIELKQDQLYQFFPWNYGPFSKEVYDDLTFFILRGFIQNKTTNDELIVEEANELSNYLESTGVEGEYAEYNEESFALTDKGVDFTKKMYSTLSSNQKKILQEFKSRIQDMPLRALLRYVYTTYPDQTSKSVIKDQIL